MAVERLVHCWLQLQHTDAQFCTRQHHELGWAKYWLRRQEQAHKLYAAAEKSLLLVRTLLSQDVRSGAASCAETSLPPSATSEHPHERGENGKQQEATSPAVREAATVNGHGTNRIAHLAAGTRRYHAQR